MPRHLIAIILSAGALVAQNRVAPGNMYHRIYAIVPLIGAGTPADPKRPMFVPPTRSASTNSRG